MRKRISCRVIQSIPLNYNDDGLRDANESFAAEPMTRHLAGLTHSEHAAVMRTYTENGSFSQTLNLLA